MGDNKVYDEATTVSAEGGAVILDGPDGVDLRMTPEAADETAGRMLEGAAEAAGQRHFGDKGRSKGPIDEKPS